MNIPNQVGGRPGGFHSVFPGTVSGPISMSGEMPIQTSYQSAIRLPPNQNPGLNFQTLPNGSLPPNSTNGSVNSRTGGVPPSSKPMGSVISNPSFDMPSDEGIIHNIREIRMPQKPKTFRMG